MSDIPLLPGNQAFPDAMWDRFAVEEQASDLGEVGGAIRLVGFDRGDHWVVATAGLSRIPLTQGQATEFWMEIHPEQVGAAVIALEIVIREIIENDQVMWGPEKIWINSEVLFEGTNIQAIAASPFPDGAQDVNDAGRVVGQVRELLLLTKHEARALALEGPDAFLTAREQNRHVFQDVERDDVTSTRAIPDVACMVSKMLHDHPPRWVESDEQGRFIALSAQEPDGYLDDPNNLELWSLLRLADEAPPEIVDFLIDANPGEYVAAHDDHWHRGRLDELEEAPQD